MRNSFYMVFPLNFVCRNLIKTAEVLSCLTLCARLVELSLLGNPVAKLDDYRRTIGEIVPQLMILDGKGVASSRSEFAEKISSSEFSSSLSSSLLSQNNCSAITSSCNDTPEIGPFSSIERNLETVFNIRNRPSTAGTHSMHKKSLSIFIDVYVYIFSPCILEPFSDSNRSLRCDDVIVGNIIDKVRTERRCQSNITASDARPFTSPSLSCTISSRSSKSNDTSSGRQFPSVLPQSIVELELGIIEIQSRQLLSTAQLEISSFSANDTNSNDLLQCGYEAIVKLLAAARKWRETSQRSRSTGVHSSK